MSREATNWDSNTRETMQRMKPAEERILNVFACVIDKLTTNAESQKASVESHLQMRLLASAIVSESEDVGLAI